MDSVTIGLDIGSSAIRAAEVEVDRGRRVLRRYAQVGIPAGQVVDGEVVNVPAVAEALRRLWTEGGFSSQKVVLGVSGPRVFVRQAEVPPMSADDLRSSLRFDGQELVPIPLDEASFDFAVLGREPGEDPGSEIMRILLVAAHRDVLRSYLTVLKAAGLTAVAMDSSALALLRAVPPGQGPDGAGMEVLVSIGAELTTVAVREAGVPRFIRTLTVGGTRLTMSIANAMHLEPAVAERIKRGDVPPGAPQLGQARKAVSTEVRDLAEDVRATVDFFLAQAGEKTLDRVLITGGAAQTQGLAAAIGGNLPVQVLQVAPFAGLPADNLGLDPEAYARAAATATTAVGLALWTTDDPSSRLSILPEEVAKARQARRLMRGAGVGVLGLATVLGAAATLQAHQVSAAEQKTRAAEQQVATLKNEVNQLQLVTAVHGQMVARGAMEVTALKGDIDWVRVLGQLASVMPPNVHILNFSGSRSTGASAATSGSGTITFGVGGTGDTTAAAAWLEGLERDPDFKTSWVGGVSVNIVNGVQTASFSSTATLTPAAQSNRSKEAQP